MENHIPYWKTQLPNQTQLDEWKLYSPVTPPNLKVREHSNYPFGRLTVRGATQARELGASLRQRYVNRFGILPINLQAGLVHTTSTNMSRTQQTAQNVLLGLYPTNHRKQVTITPITVQDHDQSILLPSAACMPFVRKLFEAGHDVDPELIERVKRELGIRERLSLTRVCERLHCHYTHKLPMGVSEETYRSAFRELVDQWFVLYQNDQMRTIALGPLMTTLRDKLEMASNNDPSVASDGVVYLWSCHDTTIIPLLACFGVEKHWPAYASCMCIELYESRRKPGFHVVKVLVNGNEVQFNGKAFVSLNEFEKLCKTASKEDITELCSSSDKVFPRS